ncbi:MAG: hypothetical protein ACI8Q1_000529 [Parvicella sp.]|jgi:hypothetical protein
MTNSEALVYLNCEEDKWEDVVVNSVFEHKQFLLKSITTPPVFLKRSEKLMQLQLASNALSDSIFLPEEEEKIELELNSVSKSSILNFYRSYETLMSKYKLGLMRTVIPGEASYFVRHLALLEDRKLIALSTYKSLTALSLEEVKISDFVNSGEVMHEIKSKETDEITAKNIASYPNFQKDILRSVKYANFIAAKRKN